MIESLSKVRAFVVSASGFFVFHPVLSDFGVKTRFFVFIQMFTCVIVLGVNNWNFC